MAMQIVDQHKLQNPRQRPDITGHKGEYSQASPAATDVTAVPALPHRVTSDPSISLADVLSLLDDCNHGHEVERYEVD
jgi:hypothetical protein